MKLLAIILFRITAIAIMIYITHLLVSTDAWVAYTTCSAFAAAIYTALCMNAISEWRTKDWSDAERDNARQYYNNTTPF